jgi:hypothetical protein
MSRKKEQKTITFEGKTLTVAEWGIEVGGNIRTVGDRLCHGWSEEQAVSTKVGFRKVALLEEGLRFAHWTVLSDEGQRDKKGGSRIATCQCDCGKKRNVRVARLKKGESQSCGCFNDKSGLEIGRKWWLGKKMSEEACKNNSAAHKGKFTGEESHRWIKDRSKVKVGDRILNDPLQKQWSLGVKRRDGWKCRIDDVNCEGRLESHHILPWKDFPELRYEVNNGITLCHAHHPKKKEDAAKLSPLFQEMVASSDHHR